MKQIYKDSRARAKRIGTLMREILDDQEASSQEAKQEASGILKYLYMPYCASSYIMPLLWLLWPPFKSEAIGSYWNLMEVIQYGKGIVGT